MDMTLNCSSNIPTVWKDCMFPKLNRWSIGPHMRLWHIEEYIKANLYCSRNHMASNPRCAQSQYNLVVSTFRGNLQNKQKIMRWVNFSYLSYMLYIDFFFFFWGEMLCVEIEMSIMNSFFFYKYLEWTFCKDNIRKCSKRSSFPVVSLTASSKFFNLFVPSPE